MTEPADRPFGLGIPASQNEIQTLKFDIRPGAVGKWLQQLPLGSASDAARALYTALFETNRVSIDARRRFKLLEQLRAPMDLISSNLRRQFIGRSLPLSLRARQQAGNLQGLLYEFAIGYKKIVTDLLAESRHAHRKLLAQAIHRTLGCLSETVRNSSQLYQQAEEHVWEEIHRLYYIGEKMDLLSINCKDPLKRQSPLNTISLAYRHLVLFALCQPARLRQRDIGEAHELLADYAFMLDLQKERPKQPGMYDLHCRLNMDEPPSMLGIPADSLPRYLRHGSLQPLTEALLEAIGNTTLPPGHISLAQRLLKLWRQEHKRSHKRRYTDGTVQLGMGLFTTHRLLNGEDVKKQPVLTRPSRPIIEEGSYQFSEHNGINPVVDTHTEFSISDHEKNHQTQLKPSRKARPLTEMDLDKAVFDPASASPQTRIWKMLDSSDGGYCLIWDHDEPCDVQVGELVAVSANKEDRHRWQIGVVRWLHYLGGYGIKVGIQILSHAANAAESRPHDTAKLISHRFDCIDLELGTERRLLIPAQRCQVGDTLTIRETGRRMDVRLTALVEDTGNYALFSYEPHEHENTRAAS